MKKFYFSASFCLLLSFPAFSQACDPMFDAFCEETDIPLDSGVGLLIAAGVFYGIKKNKKAPKTKELTSI
ncbi:MAG: hypothetical protein EOO07_37895 [Chitinophagaceae bacterium]|nr:MAG: hypothetical protein EOO07_37895 [Chitinophagaceae bacterium]